MHAGGRERREGEEDVEEDDEYSMDEIDNDSGVEDAASRFSNMSMRLAMACNCSAKAHACISSKSSNDEWFIVICFLVFELWNSY